MTPEWERDAAEYEEGRARDIEADIERLERENRELRAALQALVDAVARARTAEDNFLREGDMVTLREEEDAQATLIICENEARAFLRPAAPPVGE